MRALLFYSIAAFGFAYIVGHSVITRQLREFIFDVTFAGIPVLQWIVALLECPACLGFWTGFAAAMFDIVPSFGIGSAVLWGLFTAGSNYTLARLTRLIE